MATNTVQHRRQRYFRLSSQIAQLDNAQLRSLFDASETSEGWGSNHSLKLGSSTVFVKRIPVTGRELDNLFSTENLYNLPTCYNYGVGSAGFGVFRELVACIKTTNWVLSGEIETFPLLYHYRIVPRSGERAPIDMERHNRYVAYWGGDRNIGRYVLERAGATHELLLFFEHMPYVLLPWLEQQPQQVQWVLDDLRASIDFLRKQGVIHFDAHFDNVVTDGKRAYLADFGLVLDRGYALREDERAFWRAHTYYDYGEILSCLAWPVYRALKALPDSDQRRLQERFGVEDRQMMPVLLDHIEELDGGGVLRLNKTYLACVLKYRDIIALMNGFFSGMRHNPNKDTPFPHTQLRRGLQASGFVSRPGSKGGSDVHG